jgi:flagellar protein FlaG
MSNDDSISSIASTQVGLDPKPAANPVVQKNDLPPVKASDKNIDLVAQSARIDEVENVSIRVAEQSFSVERIREMIAELEAALPAQSNSLSFHVDEALDRPVITVVDKNSGEIVRTLPSEEIIRVAHNIEKMRGILFDSPI